MYGSTMLNVFNKLLYLSDKHLNTKEVAYIVVKNIALCPNYLGSNPSSATQYLGEFLNFSTSISSSVKKDNNK